MKRNRILSLESLSSLSDVEWAETCLRNSGPSGRLREVWKRVLDVRWDLNLSGRFDGDDVAKRCHAEAVRRVRKMNLPLSDAPDEERHHILPPRGARKKVKAEKKPGTGRKGWKGHNACGLIRFLAHKGWPFLTVHQVLPRLGLVGLSDATYKIQYRKGKSGVDVRALPDHDLKELEALKT